MQIHLQIAHSNFKLRTLAFLPPIMCIFTLLTSPFFPNLQPSAKTSLVQYSKPNLDQYRDEPSCALLNPTLLESAALTFEMAKDATLHVPGTLPEKILQCLADKLTHSLTRYENQPNRKMSAKHIKSLTRFLEVFKSTLTGRVIHDLTPEGLIAFSRIIDAMIFKIISANAPTQLGAGGIAISRTHFWSKPVQVGFYLDKNHSLTNSLQAINNIVSELYKQLKPDMFTLSYHPIQKRTRPGFI